MERLGVWLSSPGDHAKVTLSRRKYALGWVESHQTGKIDKASRDFSQEPLPMALWHQNFLCAFADIALKKKSLLFYYKQFKIESTLSDFLKFSF